MKRLFALLLICLLPMQVFAGMLTSQVNELFDTQQESVQESSLQVPQPVLTTQLAQLMAEEIAQDEAVSVVADEDSGDAADTAYNDASEDFPHMQESVMNRRSMALWFLLPILPLLLPRNAMTMRVSLRSCLPQHARPWRVPSAANHSPYPGQR